MKLENKIAIVTGASRGIGREIALVFAREGANVVVNYSTEDEKAREVVEMIREVGRRTFAYKADVSKKRDVEGMVKATMKEYGGVDILVNNAAIIHRREILKTSEEHWDRIMAVNLKGVFNCIKTVAKHMVRQRAGKIINISSVSGIGSASYKNAAYACSKAGVIMLTKMAALELGRYNINVNCLAPGLTLTDMTWEGRTEAAVKTLLKDIKKVLIIQRIGKPEDIANVAVFLASDEASYITAKTITVDGGRLNYM